MTKLAIITDHYKSIEPAVVELIEFLGRDYEVQVFETKGFSRIFGITLPMSLAKKLNKFEPQSIHLASEGPLGIAGLIWCLRVSHPFTTSFHGTPRDKLFGLRIPSWLAWGALKFFHSWSSAVMTMTPEERVILKAKGFKYLRDWHNPQDFQNNLH